MKKKRWRRFGRGALRLIGWLVRNTDVVAAIGQKAKFKEVDDLVEILNLYRWRR
jgi:hypothetical protein